MTYKLLVLEGITERGLQLLKAEGWQIDQQKAMPPAELARIVGAYDAMTIRSGSQITAEVLEAAQEPERRRAPGRRRRQRGPRGGHAARHHGDELADRQPRLHGGAGPGPALRGGAQRGPGGRVHEGGALGTQGVPRRRAVRQAHGRGRLRAHRARGGRARPCPGHGHRRLRPLRGPRGRGGAARPHAHPGRADGERADFITLHTTLTRGDAGTSSASRRWPGPSAACASSTPRAAS